MPTLVTSFVAGAEVTKFVRCTFDLRDFNCSAVAEKKKQIFVYSQAQMGCLISVVHLNGLPFVKSYYPEHHSIRLEYFHYFGPPFDFILIPIFLYLSFTTVFVAIIFSLLIPAFVSILIIFAASEFPFLLSPIIPFSFVFL